MANNRLNSDAAKPRRLAQTLAMKHIIIFIFVFSICLELSGTPNIAPYLSRVEFETFEGHFVSIEMDENGRINSFEVRGNGATFKIPPDHYKNIRKPLLSGVKLYRSGEKYWTVEVPFRPEELSAFHCAWKFQFEGTEYVGVIRSRRSTIEAIEAHADCWLEGE